MTGMGFLITMLNVIVLGLGGFFAIRGIITVGELVGFLLYINLVMQPIRRLTNFTQQFEQGMTGFARFDEIMREEPEFEDGSIELKEARGAIEFRDVSFSYNEKEQVLHGISLQVDPGTNIALVGSSGGGKTTICHLIPRFYDVNSGEILIDGINIKDYTLESLRGNIGLVQQDVFLFTGTIGENILYGRPDASYEDMVDAAKKADIHEFISALPDGYQTWVGEKGVRLSGGQKQRISIARVFLKNPPILLLDEATSSLDNETEAVIQESLEELTRGRTSMVIAHRLSTIRNADIIFVLSEEGIVERGSHAELYEHEDGIYRRLYDAQFFAEQNKPHLFD
jgi:ATP-binding cassette subfamily B protein